MWQSIWEGGVCCIALELRRIVWGCSSAMPTSSGGSGGQMGGVQLGYEQSSGGQGDMFQPLHRDGSDQRSGDEQHCSPDLSTGSPLHVRIQSPPRNARNEGIHLFCHPVQHPDRDAQMPPVRGHSFMLPGEQCQSDPLHPHTQPAGS